MAIDKKSLQEQQAKQFSQLLKDYGMSGTANDPSPKERRKLDKLFPD